MGRGASLFLLAVSLFCAGCEGVQPAMLGVKNGMLAPCPSSPNCVSSQSSDEKHAVEPIPFAGPMENAVAQMKDVIASMRRATVITKEGTYLHAEFWTFLGFVDDVELYFDGNRKVIHIRSASRVGYSDFGVNRRRVEAMRERFLDRGNAQKQGG